MQFNNWKLSDKSLTKLEQLKELLKEDQVVPNKFRDYFSKTDVNNSSNDTVHQKSITINDSQNSIANLDDLETNETESHQKILSDDHLDRMVANCDFNNLSSALFDYIKEKQPNRKYNDVIISLFHQNKTEFLCEYLKLLIGNLDHSELYFYHFIEALQEQDIVLVYNTLLQMSSIDLRQQFRTISLMYKKCHDNLEIYDKTIKILSLYSQKCTADNNFGKLLYTVVQNEHAKDYLDVLESVIVLNNSVFHKPCLNQLNKHF